MYQIVERVKVSLQQRKRNGHSFRQQRLDVSRGARLLYGVMLFFMCPSKFEKSPNMWSDVDWETKI